MPAFQCPVDLAHLEVSLSNIVIRCSLIKVDCDWILTRLHLRVGEREGGGVKGRGRETRGREREGGRREGRKEGRRKERKRKERGKERNK